MTKFSRIVVLCTLVMPVVSRSTAAQQSDSVFPRHSAWGAEAIATANGAEILRFVSGRSAWVAGLSLSTSHTDRPASGFLSANSSSQSYFTAQLGHRWYLNAVGDNGGHLRPTVGLGAIGTMARNEYAEQYDRQWSGGGYVEGGVTWFFSPHFSLGAVAILQATKGRERQSVRNIDGNGQVTDATQTTDVWSAYANLTRVLAAVYF